MNDEIYLDDLIEFIDSCSEPLRHDLYLYLGQLMCYYGYKILYDHLIRKVDFNE